jgi:hypothetical protein
MQTAAPAVTQVCVIYQPVDGAIVHIHFEIFGAGMKLHTEHHMEHLALQRASAKRRNVTDVKFLHLRDPKHAGWPKRVDPRTGKIEFADLPTLGKPNQPSGRP